jgi:drug/metabolite transporter (DMT)-like permease
VLGYWELVASAVLYAGGIVAQSTAARRAEHRPGADLGLIARLAADRLYLAGFTAQVGGFVLAFLARGSLPLYLVQAGAASAIGLATLFGVLVLGWRVTSVEIGVLALLAVGMVLLGGAATSSTARGLTPVMIASLVGVLVLTALLGVRSGRPNALVSAAVPAGIAFAVVAVAGRALAGGDLTSLPWQPLAWILVVAAVLGQALLAGALQRGSATSAVATMDATSLVLASAVGMVAMGDRIAPGREWWVAVGMALVVIGVLALGKAPQRTAAPVKEAV